MSCNSEDLKSINLNLLNKVKVYKEWMNNVNDFLPYRPHRIQSEVVEA